MKLITPPGMLLTVALLSIYSAYAFLIGSIEKSWVLEAAGVASMIGTYGVAMLRPWSRFLVYALTAGFVAKLGWSIYDGVVSGYFGLQDGTITAVTRTLLPTLAMILLSALCCVLVHRHFKGASSAARP